MSVALDAQRLRLAFQSRPDIIEGIEAAADSPSRVNLFNNIASFVYDLQTNGEPAAKRRRVGDGRDGLNGANGADAAQEPVLLEIKEISMSIPQRKKFDLCFTANHLYARAANAPGPVQGIVYHWQDFGKFLCKIHFVLSQYAFYLPVPEKAQVQHNYILFPKGTCLASLKGIASATDPLVFTVPATPPKQGTIGGTNAAKSSPYSDSYQTLFHWALKDHLRKAGNAIDIVSTDPNKFHSVIAQPHRPKEKAVHVKSFRGSKDGYLFFLENGVLWGYKKPLLFIPLDRISAVSYTSVLQRTFNIVVEVLMGEGESTEVEFAMIDQADYAGIDETYVKKKRLQDRSMAEQRKAKLELAENIRAAKKAGGAGEDEEAQGDNAEAPEAGGMSELEKAQLEAEQKLQDEEDELEEDYDPGSDGDSDGSGSSSEEDDDEDGEEEYDEEEDGDGEGEEDGSEEGEEEMADAEEEAVEEAPPAPKPKPKQKGVTQVLHADVDDGFSHSRYGNDDEMDVEERFDVVG